MKTKIVYVLTSDDSDIYLEQSYVSIYTLRKHNPDAYVVLIVDADTDKTIVGNRNYILSVITEKVVIPAPCGYTKVEISRYLKNTIRQNIDGDLLYIDSDTVITDRLDDIDYVEADVCGVLDNHVTLDEHPKFHTLFQRQAKYVDWKIQPSDYHYFNGGVLFVKDNNVGRELFRRWNEEWEKGRKRGLHSDQPSLGKVNAELGYVIKELDGAWNCQIADNGMRYFDKAKIIHYFSSTIINYETEYAFLLMNESFFYPLKKYGKLDTKSEMMLASPKELFNSKVKLVCGINLSIYNSPLFYRLYVIYVRHPKIYNFLNRCCTRYEIYLNKRKRC